MYLSYKYLRPYVQVESYSPFFPKLVSNQKLQYYYIRVNPYAH